MSKTTSSPGSLGAELLAEVAVRGGGARKSPQAETAPAMSSSGLAALYGAAFVVIFGTALIIGRLLA